MIRVDEITPIFRRATKLRDSICPVHGRYTAKQVPIPGKEIWTGCPACEEERRARAQAQDMERAMAEIRLRRVEDALGQAAIPPRFLSKTLDTFRTDTSGQAECLKACREYVANWGQAQQQGRCILLLGKPGTGKTHLAVGIAHELLAMGRTAVYTRVSGICQAVKETYASRERTEKQVYQEFAAPDLLVIDEVGRQHGSEAERMMLFEVVNRRYEGRKPMVIVSNMDPRAFAEFLGAACFSRLLEGGGQTVLFGGQNMRLDGSLA